ncbi:MAG TPA: hypothetical protein VKK61_03595 [Tepidisphaeraceae bacterium]|nr:hypothetical protein [Tepidisphaeraceae bacterium]
MVQLSGHDIEDILSEQSSTGQRFGDIALQMGLCKPEDVWRAWSGQLDESPQRVNLEQFGVDSQAIEHLPLHLAIQYHIVPVRILADKLVVAIDEAAYPLLSPVLATVLERNLKFVLCTHREIATAIRSYYTNSLAA